jgi:oligopeptide/dipeptide ABC transporter ATP-binding protein
MSAAPLLSIRGLRTVFPTRQGLVRAVDGVDLDVAAGECLGVVGESGSGKSVTFQSVLGLVRPPGRIEAGEIRFDGRDIAGLPADALRALRGGDIAMTMQDALTALNPAFTVETQIVETLCAHRRVQGGARALRATAVELLARVGIPDPESRLGQYPHQFSGGMRQRVMIAIAIACRPRLLIADEPTTALDVTIQAQVLDLLAAMRAESGMGMVLISHDLGVVASHCDRVAVMYGGQVVESGPTRAVIDAPRHPYTRGLLRSRPDLAHPERPIVPIGGQIPDPAAPPPGCRFRPRCPEAGPGCDAPVALRDLGAGRAARCVRVAA